MTNILKECEVCGVKTHYTSATLTHCRECEQTQIWMDKYLKTLNLQPWFFSPNQRKVVIHMLNEFNIIG